MSALDRLTAMDAVARLAARDATLFSDDEDVRASVAGRLGWVGLAERARDSADALAEAAAAVREAGIADVALLGMGGSSLAPLVIAGIIGPAEGAPALDVLDTTSPFSVVRSMERLSPSGTLVMVSSKSGSTIEPLSLYGLFRAWSDAALGEDAGARYAAVTDPGSPLEKLAVDHGFAAVFHAPPDVGGRYSALTPFGIVPAALIGVDVARLADGAAAMEAACRLAPPDNPGLALAAFIGDALEDGRDKLTLLTTPRLAPFGLWVEQLIAESTGKHGVGVVPVLEDGGVDPGSYGADRMVVTMRLAGEPDLGVAGALPDGVPLHEIEMPDEYALGAEFVRWETATALVGLLLGIDPFDQPDVESAKRVTTAIIAGDRRPPEPGLHLGDTQITTDLPTRPASDISSLTSALEALLDGVTPGDYLALLAYLPEDRELVGPLREALDTLSSARGIPCCFELGPRYLHSTGQLHKGGRPSGHFLMVTSRAEFGPAVPGKGFTLARLHRAQADGDYVTLAERGLPVVRVDLPEPAHGPVMLLAETLRGLA